MKRKRDFSEPGFVDVCLGDGVFWINATAGRNTALFTVRSKDHDLTVEQLDELANALRRAADLIRNLPNNVDPGDGEG